MINCRVVDKLFTKKLRDTLTPHVLYFQYTY